MTLSKYFQKTFSEMVTKEMVEYLKEGYMISAGDSSMGNDFRVELTRFDGKVIRIIVDNSYVQIDKENMYDAYEISFKVVELGQYQTFENVDTKVIKHEKFYAYSAHEGTKLFTKEELIKNMDKKWERLNKKLDSMLYVQKVWSKTPSKKINIKGFKSAKPEDITIIREFNKKSNSNTYTIINNISNKRKEFKF